MDKNDLFEQLETERLLLRKIEDSDAEMLYNNIYNNFDYYKFYYQLKFNNFDEYKSLVEKYKEWYKNGNHFRWGIVLKDTNDMIGVVQLHTKDNLNNNCKIGYIISYKYNKKGYCTEAVKKVIEFGFDTLGYHRIEADAAINNINSIKLLENIGMKFESIKEDGYKIGENYYDQKIYKIINKGSR